MRSHNPFTGVRGWRTVVLSPRSRPSRVVPSAPFPESDAPVREVVDAATNAPMLLQHRSTKPVNTGTQRISRQSVHPDTESGIVGTLRQERTCSSLTSRE